MYVFATRLDLNRLACPWPALSRNASNELVVAGVQVLSSKTVLPNHFWLGVKEDAGASNGAGDQSGKRRRAH